MRMMRKEGSAFSLGRSSLSRSPERKRRRGREGGGGGGHLVPPGGREGEGERERVRAERGRKGAEKWARQGGKKSGGNERTRWAPRVAFIGGLSSSSGRP